MIDSSFIIENGIGQPGLFIEVFPRRALTARGDHLEEIAVGIVGKALDRFILELGALGEGGGQGIGLLIEAIHVRTRQIEVAGVRVIGRQIMTVRNGASHAGHGNELFIGTASRNRIGNQLIASQGPEDLVFGIPKNAVSTLQLIILKGVCFGFTTLQKGRRAEQTDGTARGAGNDDISRRKNLNGVGIIPRVTGTPDLLLRRVLDDLRTSSRNDDHVPEDRIRTVLNARRMSRFCRPVFQIVQRIAGLILIKVVNDNTLLQLIVGNDQIGNGVKKK